MEKNPSKYTKTLLSEQIVFAAVFLLSTSSCFPQVSQQKRVGIVSTNTAICKEYTQTKICKPFQ